MDSNWYVIQVRSQKENEIAQTCKTLISQNVLQECFVPKYKKMKKVSGKWLEVEEVLFNGYVFIVTDYIDLLFHELRKIPDLTKLLGNDGNEIYPIREDEVFLLQKFLKISNDYSIGMSIGYIEGDTVTITSGPLKGFEGLIKKIDRHKRVAYLDVQLFEQVSFVKVGLEIVSKNEKVMV